MGANNSVIECALMGSQQTHKPKKARRWRRILKQARQGGTAPRLQSLIQLSFRFFAALVGLGLLSYLVFRTGPGVVWKQLQAVGWGFALVILLGGALTVSQDVRLETGVYLRHQRPFLVP